MEGVHENANKGINEQEESTDSNPSPLYSDTKLNKKLRSKVWDTFVPCFVDGKLARAECKHCHQVLKCIGANGTGSLLRHQANCSTRTQKSISADKNTEIQSHKEIALSEQVIPTGANWKNQEVKHNYSREEIIRVSSMYGHHPTMMELDRFKKLVAYLNPTVKIPSFIDLNVHSWKSFEEEESKLKEKLVTLRSRVCLSAYVWHYNPCLAFLCLSVHYIDDEWKQQQKIIRFRHVDPSCNAKELSNVIFVAIEEWHLGGKVFSIILDDAFIDDTVASEVKTSLQKWNKLAANHSLFVVRYATHLLDQVIQLWVVKKEVHEADRYRHSREEEAFSKVREKMKRKFMECWTVCFMHFFMPMVMDPNYRLKHIMSHLDFNAFDDDRKDYLQQVHDTLASLFNEYSNLKEDPNSASGAKTSKEAVVDGDMLMEYYFHSKYPYGARPLSEFDQYLQEPCLTTGESSVLQWWKEHHLTYPTISQMARDILALPCSTDCKEATRTARMAITESGYKYWVERLVCVQNWLKTAGMTCSLHVSLFHPVAYLH
uniref:BED-type domain-containing protein n=1 Tax=Setaria italica TaxID=4555 RepID=K3ZZH2_SETIT